MTKLASLPLFLLFILPLLATLILALVGGFDAAGWAALIQHSQFFSGLVLSFATGSIATVAACAIALLIAAAFFERGQTAKLAPHLGIMLAVPHLAFAIGFGFLIMPSGILARILALGVGWVLPPQWATTHDPFGIALTIALVAKETAFLLFVLVNVLSREDIAQSFKAQQQVSASLGHSSFSTWQRLLVPQLIPHIIWPLVIVFIYASTVVDMSLVLGPTQPPVFADVIWADINSADPTHNARGAAGAVFIAFLAFAILGIVWAVAQLSMPLLKRWIVRGPSHTSISLFVGKANWLALKILYAFVVSTLVVLSFAAFWPFPDPLPRVVNGGAWQTVAAHSAPAVTSLGLALSTSLTALLILVLWLENVPQKFDRWILVLCVMVLGLPSLLIGLGQYQLFLKLHITGTLWGLYLAHLTPVVAYMFIMVKGPYRSYDVKWRNAATGLMARPNKFLIQIKWPMLKAPLLSSLAVGFAVSFAQFVPAQLVAAGRYSTLPIEAVTLSSGSNRPLTAAFALVLMIAPLLAFVIGSFFGRPRWGQA